MIDAHSTRFFLLSSPSYLHTLSNALFSFLYDHAGKKYRKGFAFPNMATSMWLHIVELMMEFPENTLAAYRRGLLTWSVTFVKSMFEQPRTIILVSIHDASIDRYTIDGSKGVVAEMTLAQLQAIDVGSRVDPKWKEERVPMVDAISLCKGRIGIYLDVKASSIESLHRLVREHEMDSDTLWYIPQAKVQELRDRSTRCWPMPDPGPEIFLASLLKEQKPKTVASAAKFFSSTFAEACHQTGAIVIVDENGRDS